jgi:Putative peptidoglycan binding domain
LIASTPVLPSRPSPRSLRAVNVRRLAVAVAVAVLLPAANAQALPTLHHGDRGRTVRKLQRALHLSDDGVFGKGTLRAVRRFQRQHGLTADGIVGPATWAALGLPGRHPVLKRAHLRGGGPARSGVPLAVFRAVAAANRIAGFPYRFGGGHRSFHDSAYDCSGSVSYVLHAAGRLGSPLDSGELMSWGAPGRGRYITVYANPGHTYMVIQGRRYDTTGRWDTGSRWQRVERSSAGYVARHPVGL